MCLRPLTYAHIRISHLQRLVPKETINADVAEVARRVAVAVLAHPVPKRLIVRTAVGMIVARTLCANKKLFEFGDGLHITAVHRFIWQHLQTN